MIVVSTRIKKKIKKKHDPRWTGVYTCAAINEAAKIEVDAELMIETFSPRAPSNLTANSSRDAITIHWTQNYIRPDLKFSIWYHLYH